jgi:hypothetical protein
VDSDVELPEGWARTALRLLDERPEVAGVGGPGRTPAAAWVSRALDALQYGHRPGDGARYVPSLATMDVLYRARSVGGRRFRDFWAAEDPEFNFRLVSDGHRLLWSRDLSVLHHHPASLGDLARKAFRYGMWFPAPYWHHREQITPDILFRLAWVPVLAFLAAAALLAPVAWRGAALTALAAWALLPALAYGFVAAFERRSLGFPGALQFVLVHAVRQYAQMAGVWAGVLAGTWREWRVVRG